MAAITDVSIPVNLLLESISQIITVELKKGDKYRGELVHAESNMSLHLSDVTATYKNGQTRKLQQIYLRGSQVKYFVLPDILEGSPVFKKVKSAKRKFDKVQRDKVQATKRQRVVKTG